MKYFITAHRFIPAVFLYSVIYFLQYKRVLIIIIIIIVTISSSSSSSSSIIIIIIIVIIIIIPIFLSRSGGRPKKTSMEWEKWEQNRD